MHAGDDLDATIAEYSHEDPQFPDRLAAAEIRLLERGFGTAASTEGKHAPAADLLLTSAEAQALLRLPEEEILALARAEKVRVLEPSAGEFFFDARGLQKLRRRRAAGARTAA